MTAKTPIPANVAVETYQGDAFQPETTVLYFFDEERWAQIDGPSDGGAWSVLVVDEQFMRPVDSTTEPSREAAEERVARWLQSWAAGLRG